jgi:hypothetical protein
MDMDYLVENRVDFVVDPVKSYIAFIPFSSQKYHLKEEGLKPNKTRWLLNALT